MWKKLLSLLPALALMLVLVLPVRAEAISTLSDYPTSGVPWAERGDFQTYDIRDHYIMFNGMSRYNYGSDPRPYNVSQTFFISCADASFTITENDGVFDFIPNSMESSDVNNWLASMMCIRYFTDDMSIYNTYYYSGYSNFNFYAFRYDSNQHTLVYTDSSLRSLDTPYVSLSDVYLFETDITDFSTGLKVDVTFTPELSGDVSRRLVPPTSTPSINAYDYNDNQFVTDDFNILVENHTNKDLQVFMCICEVGTHPLFDQLSDYQYYSVSGIGVENITALKYVWMSEEWNYFYTSTLQHRLTEENNVETVQTLSACSWHFVSAKSSIVHSFKWSSIDLEINHDYSVLVYAVENTCGMASRQFQFPYSPRFVDLSTAELVHDSVFNVTTPYTFNPNETAFGNVPSHSEGLAAWSSSATKDNDTGEINVQNKGAVSYYDARSKEVSELRSSEVKASWYDSIKNNNSGGSLSGSGIGDSGNSFSSLSGTISGFFSFFSTVLGFFPASFYSVIFLGLVALIITGIIKAVK